MLLFDLSTSAVHVLFTSKLKILNDQKSESNALISIEQLIAYDWVIQTQQSSADFSMSTYILQVPVPTALMCFGTGTHNLTDCILVPVPGTLLYFVTGTHKPAAFGTGTGTRKLTVF